MNGDHGQIVQQHAVKESKQEPEHVRMMLQTLASPSLSKKFASCLQLIGGPGQAVLQLVVMESRQEQDHVVTIKAAPVMSQKLRIKIATSKNAVMTLGHHGVRLTVYAPIRVQALSKNLNAERDILKLRVQKKETMLKPKLGWSNVIIEAIGDLVSPIQRYVNR